MATNETYEDILEIVAWSLQQLGAGVFPDKRHDGTAWLQSDTKRANQQDKPLGIKGALVEIRGDLKFFKECVHFPGWNELDGICWKCNCPPDQASYIYIYI